MKNEDLYNAVSDIEPSLLEEAENFIPKKRKRNIIPIAVSAAAALAVAVALAVALHLNGISVLPGMQAENAEIQDVNDTTANGNISENETGVGDFSESPSEEAQSSQSTQSAHSYIQGVKPQVLSKPVYPEIAQHPMLNTLPGETNKYNPGFDKNYDEWREACREFLSTSVESDGINEFSFELLEKLLGEADGKNKAVSPLNIYMALSVLAETCDGNSRQQILSALGVGDIEQLRETASALWRKNYFDDGASKSVIANSLWLNDNVKYNKKTVMTIAEKYLTSVHSGTMGSKEYDDMMNFWIKEQTGGLLAPELHMPPSSVLTIVSTLLFNEKWNNEFNKALTQEGIFNSPDGEIPIDFMKCKRTMRYFWGEKFSAVYLDFDLSGKMWFILPDEGTDAEEVFLEEELQSLLLMDYNELYEYENSDYLIVDMAVPKFDISSEKDIIDVIGDLGMTDITDPLKADFSPLSEDTLEIYLSEATHGVRVKVDEEGISAAAYTMFIEAGGMRPPEEIVEFILDRPFAFAVTHDNETILFAGIVNKP